MEITLNKANKLLQKLKQQRFNTSNSFDIDQGSLSLVNPNDVSSVNKFKSYIQEKLLEKEENFSTYISVTEDYFNLKEALFEANLKYGVSAKMNEKEKFSRLLSSYRVLLEERRNTTVVGLDGVTSNLITNVKSIEETYYSPKVSILVYSEQSLKEKIKDLTLKINAIEDEILALNATQKINLELSDKSKELLGLR